MDDGHGGGSQVPRDGASALQGSLAELTRVVWSQRVRVERLLYRLAIARLLMLADQRQHAAHALDEVADAVAALREIEEARIALVEAFAATRGQPAGDVTLEWLAEHAPASWAAVFADHRVRLRWLVARIARLARQNLVLAERALDRIEAVGDPGDGRAGVDEIALQEIAYGSGIDALADVLPPTFVDFVAAGAAVS